MADNMLRTISVNNSQSATLDSTSFSSDRKRIEEAVTKLYRSPLARVNLLPTMVLYVLYVAACHSMRISELLQIRVGDYLGSQRFIIRGSKRSRSYTAYIPEIVPLLKTTIDLPPEWYVIRCGYKYVWGWCYRVGLGFTPEGHTNVARTHAHRYDTADLVAAKTDRSVAGDCLHHRSRLSIDYYTKRKGV
jgi:integrase